MPINTFNRFFWKKWHYLLEYTLLGLVDSSESLNVMWSLIIEELNRNPLYNSSRDMDFPEIDSWWNQNGNKIDVNDLSPKGVVHSLSDWDNMIEFWYGVRNNLFHGGKDPDIQRDRFLVEHVYKTLSCFMTNEISTK